MAWGFKEYAAQYGIEYTPLHERDKKTADILKGIGTTPAIISAVPPQPMGDFRQLDQDSIAKPFVPVAPQDLSPAKATAVNWDTYKDGGTVATRKQAPSLLRGIGASKNQQYGGRGADIGVTKTASVPKMGEAGYVPSQDPQVQTAMEYVTGLAGGTLAKALGKTVGKSLMTKAGKVWDAAKGAWVKVPDAAKPVIKTGATIGAGATGYETVRGAFDPDYAGRRETFPSQFGASVRGGVGDTVSLAGSALEWKGYEEAAKKLKELGTGISEGYESEYVPFTWQAVFNPNWWANNVARTIPTTAALIPAMFLAYKVGAKGAALRGFGKFGQVVIGSLAGSTLSRPLESALESGAVFEETGDAKKAQEVYDANMKLAALDSAQLALAFAPAPVKGVSKFGKAAIAASKTKPGKFVRATTKLAGVGVTEGLEEGYQEAVSTRATGEDNRSIIQQILRPTPELAEAMAIGSIFGFGQGGAGVINDVYTEAKSIDKAIRSQVAETLPNQAKLQMLQTIDNYMAEGMNEEEATIHVLELLAETEEGREVIIAATQTVASEYVNNSGDIQQLVLERLAESNPAVLAKAGDKVYDSFTGTELTVTDDSAPDRFTVVNAYGQQGTIMRSDVSFDKPETPKMQAMEQGQAEEGMPIMPSASITDQGTRVYDKNTGEAFTVVLQTSPEFVVVEDSEGGNTIMSVDDLTTGTIEAEDFQKGETVLDGEGNLVVVVNSGNEKTMRVKGSDGKARVINKADASRTVESSESTHQSGENVPASEEEIQTYADNVIKTGEVKSVTLIGSTVTKGKGNDVDILYDLGEMELPEDSGEAAAEIEAFIENMSAPIDLDTYDAFIKVGDRYFHLQTGAGREIVENTDYAKEQAGKPSKVLAQREAREEQATGKTVYHPQTNEPLEVLDDSDKSMLTVRNSNGSVFKIGRKAVKETAGQVKPTAQEQEPEQVEGKTAPAGESAPKAASTELYHGTNQEGLENIKGGSWFTPNKDMADKFASGRTKQKKGKANTYSVQVDLSNKNLADISKFGIDDYVTPKDIAQELGIPMEEVNNAFLQDIFDENMLDSPTALRYITEMASFTELLKAKGFDGIKAKEGLNAPDDYVPTYKLFDEVGLKTDSTKESESVSNEETEPTAPAKEPEAETEVAGQEPKATSTVKGNTATVKTERGTQIEVQYAVVNADDLIASHSTDLKLNPEYPQELQPRDRGRIASEMQVTKIANNLEPEFLGENPKASEGAPIVGNDMVVESGNGRIIAIKRVYDKSHANAEKYKQWLMDKADKFGLDATDIEGMDKPVLVRVRTSEVNRADFVKEANEQSVAAMSATEQALSDAGKLTESLLGRFYPSEDGTINNKENRNFIRDFMAEVIGPTEQGRYVTADGSISQEGVNRIRNAIFAKAYGDVTAIEKLAESTDNNIKAITNALLMLAPRFAKLKASIESGKFYPLDITPELANAARKLSQLREEQMSVESYLSQTSMFGEEMDQLSKDILKIFDFNKRSAKKIFETFATYINTVIQLGDPNQISMFEDGTPAPTKADLIDTALQEIRAHERSKKNEPVTLFQNKPKGSSAVEETGKGQQASGESEGKLPGDSQQKQEEVKVDRSKKKKSSVNFKLDNESYPTTKKTKATGMYWSEFDHKGKPDLAVVGSDKILKDGLTDFDSWSASMLKDFGVEVENRLDVLWKKANGLANFITKKEAETQKRINRTGKDYAKTEQAPSGITYESASKAERQKWYDKWKTVSSEAGDDNLQTGRSQNREGRGISDTTGDYSTNSPEFKAWFGDSKVVDENGEPLVVYHGTGAKINEFKPEFTGQGNDQLGSGFYFSTNKEDAEIYQTKQLPTGESKLGGLDNPNIVSAYLSIQKPITIKGDTLVDSDVSLSQNQAYKILKYSPSIMDKEESPLRDWFEAYYEVGPKEYMVKNVATHYTGKSLLSLENDFFKGESTAFRNALNKVLGYDGVVKEFSNGQKHYVAWFPTQIKSIYNQGTWDATNPDIRFKSDSVTAIAKDLNLTPAPEAMEQEIFQAANTLSQIFTGNDIVTFKGKGVQGMADGDTVYINAEAKDPVLYVAKHEIVHTLETTDPESYKKLMQLVRRYFNGNQEMVKHYQKQKYTAEEAWGEFTSDVVSEVMEEPGFWKLVRERSPKLIKAVVDIIDQIITKFKKAVAKDDSMLKYINDLESFKAEVAGVVAESLSKPKRRNILDLRTDEQVAAKNKAEKVIDKVTDSPAFRKWFGDSKVVDENGEPLVVYHGTNKDFSAFSGDSAGDKTGNPTAGWGFFFSHRPAEASSYATDWIKEGGNVIPSYISIKKPYIMPYSEYRQFTHLDNLSEGQAGLDRLADLAQQRKKELIEQGYDGIYVMQGNYNGKHITDSVGEIVAFSPTQIKSVNNRGTFDPNTPDIRYKRNLLDGIGTTKNVNETEAKYKFGRPQIEPQEFIGPLKGVVIEANRVHRAEVAATGLRTERWKETLSEEQLQDLGAFIEKVENLKSEKDFATIAKEINADPEMKKVLQEYMVTQESMRRKINDYLRDVTDEDYIKFVENYIPHFYINEPGTSKKVSTDKVGKWIRNSPNAKQRKIPTLKEARDLGLVPLTQNIAELQNKWANINWLVATNRKLLSSVKEFTNADGENIIMKANNAPTDWIRVKHPAFARIYARKTESGQTVLYEGEVAVDPEAYKILRQVIEEPLSGGVINAIESFNAYAKKAQLSFSLFHHWALTESAIGALGVKGLILVGKDTQGLGKGIITQPHRVGKKLMEQEDFLRDAIMHGLTLESVSDAHVGKVKSGLVSLERKTEGKLFVGKTAEKARQFNDAWDKTLWTNYHNGLKAYTYYALTEKYISQLPSNATAADISGVKEKIAETINDMYGGQEWASKFWLSPQARQMWQMLQLAPDWTLSNANVAAKAITKAKDPVMGPILRKYWSNMLLSQALIISAMCFAFSGHFPWDNEEGHKTEIEVTAITRRLNKLFGKHEKNPDQRYYMHPGKQIREVVGWVTDPLLTVRRKASPAVHTVIEQISGHSTTGWEMPWTENGVEKNFWSSLPQRTVAAAEKFVPFSIGGLASQTQFAFTFPMRKGMTPWKAVRAYEDVIRMNVDPTFAQKAYKIPAAKAKKAITGQSLLGRLDEACVTNGLDPDKMYRDARSKVVSQYYGEMWGAINHDNMRKADKAAQVLLELDVTASGLKSSAKARGLSEEDYIKAIEVMRRNAGKR